MPIAYCQTVAQFEADGCDNCDEFLELKGSEQAVQACTTPSFFGSVDAFAACVIVPIFTLLT